MLETLLSSAIALALSTAIAMLPQWIENSLRAIS